MLSTFISDFIFIQIECGECLRGRKHNGMWEMRPVVVCLTSVDCNTRAKCWAPSYPIRFLSRSSMVTVWSGEKRTVCEKRQVLICLTLFDCNASARCWAPSSAISFSERQTVVSVSKGEERIVCERWANSLFVSLYSILMPEPNVGHLHLRFHSD